MNIDWNHTGLKLCYTCCDQSSDGVIILAASGSSVYCSIDSGLSWKPTKVGMRENIVSLSINADGTIAYCCTNSTIYVCTNFSINTLSWSSDTVFSGITGKTWNSIIVSNKVNMVSVNIVYAGSTTGLYGITSGTNAVILDSNNINKNWKFITVMKTIINDIVITGIALINDTYNIYMNTDGNSNNSFLKLSSGYIPYPTSLSIFQTTTKPLRFQIYATSGINNDTLYLSTNAGTFLSISETNIASGEKWTSVSVGYNSTYTFTTSKSDGKIYSSNNGGISLESIGNQSDWLQVVNSSTNGNNLVAITKSINPIYISKSKTISCIIYNTKVLLANGEENFIQNLRINDMLKTSEGDKKIIFIGYNFTINKQHVRLLKKDKISENIPNADLLLSKGHGIMFNDEDFITYRRQKYQKYDKINGYNKLIMGDCILCEEIPLLYLENRKYFHIVLENDTDPYKQYIIYLNGVPSETMSEYWKMYANLRSIPV
jgi:hypothetical protein